MWFCSYEKARTFLLGKNQIFLARLTGKKKIRDENFKMKVCVCLFHQNVVKFHASFAFLLRVFIFVTPSSNFFSEHISHSAMCV